jgi:hypothetical protein
MSSITSVLPVVLRIVRFLKMEWKTFTGMTHVLVNAIVWSK